jgi:hypothetical protein
MKTVKMEMMKIKMKITRPFSGLLFPPAEASALHAYRRGGTARPSCAPPRLLRRRRPRAARPPFAASRALLRLTFC